MTFTIIIVVFGLSVLLSVAALVYYAYNNFTGKDDAAIKEAHSKSAFYIMVLNGIVAALNGVGAVASVYGNSKGTFRAR